MEINVFTIADDVRLKAALAVRVSVFVDEQRVPAEDEIDDHDRTDPDARHALVRDAPFAETNGVAIAAGRSYRKDERTVQIGRMAVIASHRGRGVGRRVLDALLDDARARGFSRASLNAQVHAEAFYHAAGFAPVGPPFLECDIVHQAMERDL